MAKKASKKTSPDSRKGVRQDIAPSAVKRLLHGAASAHIKVKAGKKARVSSDAASHAAAALDDVLEGLGGLACDYKDGKGNITLSLLKKLCRHTPGLAGMESVLGASAKLGKQKTLSRAGVVRVFKRRAGECRLTDKAKDGLHNLAEAWIRNLGKCAGNVTNVSGRHTVKDRDIAAAMECM